MAIIEAGELIALPDETGEESTFEVLYTFTDEQSDKTYMVIAPVIEDEVGEGEDEVQITALSYKEEGEELEISPIETEEEWKMVEETLSQYMTLLPQDDDQE